MSDFTRDKVSEQLAVLCSNQSFKDAIEAQPGVWSEAYTVMRHAAAEADALRERLEELLAANTALRAAQEAGYMIDLEEPLTRQLRRAMGRAYFHLNPVPDR